MEVEKIDVYDESKQKTGKVIIRRKERLEDGEFALATKAILINSEKKILISKRSENKPSNPGLWEINGGCCLAGENPSQAIVRELKEELGIDLSDKKGIYFKEYKKEHVFLDIWLYKVDVDISDIKFNDNEAVEARWVTIDEYEQFNKNGMLTNYKAFEVEDYGKCLKLLFGEE